MQRKRKHSKKVDFETALNENMEEVIEHSICVSNVSYYLARELDMPEEECKDMALAGMLHDIGKIKLEYYMYGQDDSEYTVEQMRYMRMHSKLSYDILKSKDYSDFILGSILFHHENYDGSGYPDNLVGTDIPIGARILRVSDVFSALISDRAYRDAFDENTAIELMIDEVKNFDMKIFLAFQRVVHEVDIEELTGDRKKPVTNRKEEM